MFLGCVLKLVHLVFLWIYGVGFTWFWWYWKYPFERDSVLLKLLKRTTLINKIKTEKDKLEVKKRLSVNNLLIIVKWLENLANEPVLKGEGDIFSQKALVLGIFRISNDFLNKRYCTVPFLYNDFRICQHFSQTFIPYRYARICQNNIDSR